MLDNKIFTMRTNIGLNRGFLFPLVTILFLFTFPSLCQTLNDNSSTKSDVAVTVGGEDVSLRAIDEGMEPLYQMTKIFLDLVNPLENGNVIDTINFKSLFSNGTDISTNLSENVETWLKHYLGFASCVAAGLLFILLMPIIGCCLCCCRCIGNCGGKSDPHDPRYAHCRRVTLALILAAINIFMLVAVVCAFVTNDLIREQTTKQEDAVGGGGGMIPKLTTNLATLGTFKDNTFYQIRHDEVGNVEMEINNLLDSLLAAPESAKIELGKVTNSETVLTAASNLAESALRINSSLTVVDSHTQRLQQLQAELAVQLSASQDNLIPHLNDVTPCNADCLNLQAKVNALDQEANFDNMDNVSEQLDVITQVINSGLLQLVNEGRKEFEMIVEKVANDTRDQIADIRNETDKILRDLKVNIDDMEQEVDNVVSFTNLTDQLASVAPQLEEYGQYAFYAGLGLCCLMLLILLCYGLGLLFGVFGETPGDGAPTCNKGVGANALLAGIGFTFLLGWLLMLVCLITFMVGSLPQTEFCRLPITPTADSVYSKSQVFDDVLIVMSPDTTFNVTGILQHCADNKGLLDLDVIKEVVDVAELLDLEDFGVKERIDTLSDVSVNLSDVNIMSEELKTQLTNLSNANLDNIDFNSFKAELNKTLTSDDLTMLSTAIRTLADTQSAGSIADNLRADADALNSINTGTVADMKEQSQALSAALIVLETEINGGVKQTGFKEYTEGVITALQNAENDIHVNGTIIIKDFITSLANDTYLRFENYVSEVTTSLKQDVGRCKPMSDVVISTMDIFCVSVLQPFNGFWFSVGWFLFFSVLAIIFGFILAGLYRKTEEYDSYLDNKSFDDARHPGRSYGNGGGGGGQNNTGYDNGNAGGARLPYVDYPPRNGTAYHQQQHDDPRSYGNDGYPGGAARGAEGGRGGAYYPAASAPTQNPPHYYNNRHH